MNDMNKMSQQPDDDYISRYLSWQQRRNNELTNNDKNRITPDIRNLNGNNNHNDSKNDAYYDLLRKMEKQIINGETSAKSLFDFNAPSLIAPNHEFWNNSNHTDNCKISSEVTNRKTRPIREICNVPENNQTLGTIKKCDDTASKNDILDIELDNLKTKIPSFNFSKPSCYKPPPGFTSPIVKTISPAYNASVKANPILGNLISSNRYQAMASMENCSNGEAKLSNSLESQSPGFESLETSFSYDINTMKKYDTENSQIVDFSNKSLFNGGPKANYFDKPPEFGSLVPSYPPPGYPKSKPSNINQIKEIPTLNDLVDITYQKSQLNCHSKSNKGEASNLHNLNQEKKPTGVWMFVDNSNIWIECKRAEAKVKFRKNPLFDEDPRLRLDMGRLAEQVRGNRPIIDAQLYGSEPPEIDTIWQLATKRGWEVNRFKRNLISGKEKQLDTSIVADITELVCHSEVRKLKFEKYQNVIVLVAGDSDFIPAIRKVIAQNGWWRIEVWGLAQS